MKSTKFDIPIKLINHDYYIDEIVPRSASKLKKMILDGIDEMTDKPFMIDIHESECDAITKAIHQIEVLRPDVGYSYHIHINLPMFESGFHRFAFHRGIALKDMPKLFCFTDEEIKEAKENAFKAMHGTVMNWNDAVNENIKLRKRLHNKGNRKNIRNEITQKEAAAFCKCHKKTIKNWESGATTPPPNYPGRTNRALFMQWVPLYRSNRRMKEAAAKRQPDYHRE